MLILNSELFSSKLELSNLVEAPCLNRKVAGVPAATACSHVCFLLADTQSIHLSLCKPRLDACTDLVPSPRPVVSIAVVAFMSIRIKPRWRAGKEAWVA